VQEQHVEERQEDDLRDKVQRCKNNMLEKAPVENMYDDLFLESLNNS
jgi:hypothetical protein